MSKSHMLFFVFGASRSGKSTILNMVEKVSSNISIHKKYTTRKQRPLEKDKQIHELSFKQKFNPEEYITTYTQFEVNTGSAKIY